MDSLNFVTSLRGLIMDHLLEVHTSIPARVTYVDYNTKTVTLEAIVKNTRGTEDEISYPTMYDVPFMINGGGTARISFPIKVGDVGNVLFSERDPSNAFQTDGSDSSSATLMQPLGIYPSMFLPKIATGADTTEPVDGQNIVLSNNQQSYLSVSPDGEIIMKNTQGISISMNEDTVTITDGTGILTITGGKLKWVGDEWDINGLTISKDGLLTDANGIGLATHTHPIVGVESGSDTVDSEEPSA